MHPFACVHTCTPHVYGMISQTANFYVKMRVSLTSLERLLELTAVPQERPHALPSDPPP